MTTDLPAWVYDVVMALQKWSEEHPLLLAEYYPDYTPKPVADCGCTALSLVPIEVKERATAIAGYVGVVQEHVKTLLRAAGMDDETIAAVVTNSATSATSMRPATAVSVEEARSLTDMSGYMARRFWLNQPVRADAGEIPKRPEGCKPLSEARAAALVGTDTRVRVWLNHNGGPAGEGVVIGYLDRPSVIIQRPDGTQSSWSIDLDCEELA